LREWEDQIERLGELDAAAAAGEIAESELSVQRLMTMFGVALAR
jgi:hypothetical protein